jgi:PKD repeat protein
MATLSAIDLVDVAAGTGGFVIHGEEAGDSAGFSVSSAGDINGDGFVDLVIGAFRADGPDNARLTAGASYVVFGRADGFGTVELADVAAGIGGFVIHGEEAGDNSGVSVSSAGDINGDGLDDLVIGAFRADGPGNTRGDAGASYVVFGQTGPFAPVDLVDVAAGTGGFVIHGAEAGDQSGFVAASAGDINGDGFDDLIIGAAFADGPGNTRGAAGDSYVVFGHDGAFGTVDLANVAAGVGGFVIHGEDVNDNSGISVSSAGDINGDGFDDLIIGAFRANGAGNASADAGDTYVVFGHDGAFATIDLAAVAAGTGGFVIHGEDPVDNAGVAVSSAGDINGDGVDDLIIGADLADGPGNARPGAGGAYVLFGHTGAFETVDLADLAAGNGGFVIHGAEANDDFGISVSEAGDVNGDGFDDLIIGAAFADGPGNTRGSAGDTYVLFGHDGAFATVDLADVAAGVGGFVIHGQDANDNSGISVSAAGDINQDGFDDLIIGASGADGPDNARLAAGGSYVLFGSATIVGDVPDAPTVDVGADQAADEGQTVSLAATFIDPDDGDTHTATIDWGDGTITDATVTAGQISGDHAYADPGVYAVTVTVTDNTGLSGSDTLIATMNDVPEAPTVDAGEDQAVGGGETVSLAATFIDPDDGDTHTATIDWGDGTIADAIIVAGHVSGDHAYADDGAYTVTVTVTDNTGLSGSDTLIATVNDAPDAPTVDAGADQAADERRTVSLAATFVDPDDGDAHTATIDWGDGTITDATVAAGQVSGDHAYADPGAYTVTVTVTDNTGLSGSDTLTATVNDVPDAPTVDAGEDQAVDERRTVSLAATFIDPDGGDTHTATIDWGDGTIANAAVAAGQVSGDHAYADPGVYAVTVTVTDNTGLSGSDTFIATVIDVRDGPTADAGADRAVDEGQTVSLAATFIDPDDGETHTATIDWGDGTIADATVAAGQVSGGHAYADDGAYTVTVTVTDDTGLSASDAFIATVNNVAPEAQSLSLSGPVEDGAPQTFSFSATDAGPADTLSFTILTSPSEGAVTNNADGTFTFDPGSAFQDLGDGETRDVSFTYQANDDDGASSTPATVTITVAGVTDRPQCPADHAHPHLSPDVLRKLGLDHAADQAHTHLPPGILSKLALANAADQAQSHLSTKLPPWWSSNADHGGDAARKGFGDGHHGSSNDHENGSRHGSNASGEDRSDGDRDNLGIKLAWSEDADSFVWSDTFRQSAGANDESAADDHFSEKSAFRFGSAGDDGAADVPGHDHGPTVMHDVATAAKLTDPWSV